MIFFQKIVKQLEFNFIRRKLERGRRLLEGVDSDCASVQSESEVLEDSLRDFEENSTKPKVLDPYVSPCPFVWVILTAMVLFFYERGFILGSLNQYHVKKVLILSMF